jgi:hypothetical protein
VHERLKAFVGRTRRTLTGEVTNAIEQYLDREEKLSPPAGPASAGASKRKK